MYNEYKYVQVFLCRRWGKRSLVSVVSSDVYRCKLEHYINTFRSSRLPSLPLFVVLNETFLLSIKSFLFLTYKLSRGNPRKYNILKTTTTFVVGRLVYHHGITVGFIFGSQILLGLLNKYLDYKYV